MNQKSVDDLPAQSNQRISGAAIILESRLHVAASVPNYSDFKIVYSKIE